MQDFSKGDRVRIDIPDETDPDYEAYHGDHGRVLAVLTDDADEVTGEACDSRLYRVKLETGETMDFRRRDLRPPIGESG
ncbi:hypothetical protein KM295_15580 [Natronomonas sp. F2-12]|uniref:DUF8139 domain-containing protein n=1 Tax=Natronomonas aquatica TaxID=2841590 RepID=A0A9R1CWR2_9EURY|nr:hypothetical protein [Natronomonas aquatica]MCQ4334876.1 hypothetical protein [Natronomonas aquatica]